MGENIYPISVGVVIFLSLPLRVGHTEFPRNPRSLLYGLYFRVDGRST